MLLASGLTPGNAGELIEAASHKTKAQIQTLLAERFPQPDLPTVLRGIPVAPAATQLVPEPVLTSSSTLAFGAAPVAVALPRAVPTAPTVPPSAPADFAARPPAPSAPPTKLTPLAPQRFALQVTLDAETHELLRRAQALLGQPGPASDVAQVLKGALQQYVQRLEQGSFAATSRPRRGRRRRREPNERIVPAALKRAVWQRDGGRCTFVGADGHRCEARTRLEFDHARPVARGGLATAHNLRLRCRAHNQFEAERVFGRQLMIGKRKKARERVGDRGAAGERVVIQQWPSQGLVDRAGILVAQGGDAGDGTRKGP